MSNSEKREYLKSYFNRLTQYFIEGQPETVVYTGTYESIPIDKYSILYKLATEIIEVEKQLKKLALCEPCTIITATK